MAFSHARAVPPSTPRTKTWVQAPALPPTIDGEAQHERPVRFVTDARTLQTGESAQLVPRTSRAMEQSEEDGIDIPTFVDDAQRRWEVRAIRDPLLPARVEVLAPPEFSHGWLLFTCDGERRRLAPLPPGWRHATEAQLRRWCADAAPAR